MAMSKNKKNIQSHLNKYEEFVKEYTQTSESISDIYEHNSFLLQYFENFRRESENFIAGVFLLDIFEIYTPVQNNDYGVVTFRKYPFQKQRVFALGDGSSSVYFKWNNFFIIFSNVVKTKRGYDFITNEPNKNSHTAPSIPCTINPITLTTPLEQEAFFLAKDEFKDGNLGIDKSDDDDDFPTKEQNKKKLMKKFFSDSDEDN